MLRPLARFPSRTILQSIKRYIITVFKDAVFSSNFLRLSLQSDYWN
jgi:hypothetical protein